MSAPGCFETLGSKMREEIVATLKGVAGSTNAGATPSELRLREMGCFFPGLTQRNPGLELANAFSVII
jgi:hypothetical protein